MVKEIYHHLALDLDGTLLNDDKQISARTLAAVHRVADTGAIVSLCSGRSTYCMKEPQQQLQLDVPIGISSMYFVVYDLHHLHSVPSHPIPSPSPFLSPMPFPISFFAQCHSMEQ